MPSIIRDFSDLRFTRSSRRKISCLTPTSPLSPFFGPVYIAPTYVAPAPRYYYYGW